MRQFLAVSLNRLLAVANVDAKPRRERGDIRLPLLTPIRWTESLFQSRAALSVMEDW